MLGQWVAFRVDVERLFPPGVVAFEIRGVALPDDLFSF
jgi:hypothetical protein